MLYQLSYVAGVGILGRLAAWERKGTPTRLLCKVWHQKFSAAGKLFRQSIRHAYYLAPHFPPP